MTQLIYPLLLCGGSGTRLWPLSRKSYPKQFAKLTGDDSLFQASAERLSGEGFAPPIVVTGSDFRFIVIEQLAAKEIDASAILIEPEGKNTAPAILASALVLHEQSPGALMLVAPSDHVIPDTERFRATVSAAVPTAADGQLVTFGIRPDRPETGYGWLELADTIDDEFEPVASPLKSFVEKPDAAKAETLLSGNGTCGMLGFFCFQQMR